MSKEKKYHFIYKTTNILTGRYYYGMHLTDDLNDGYLGSGKRLRYSIRKYGKENHKREIIEFVDNREKLKQREKEIVNLDELAKKDCMNLMVGGKGGWNHLSSEQRILGAKRCNERKRILYDTNPEWVKERSEKISRAKKKEYKSGKRKRIYFYDWNGKKHKEESKRLIGQKSSIHQTGSGNSQYGTCWITKDGKNKKIKKEELKIFLEQNWSKGRKI